MEHHRMGYAQVIRVPLTDLSLVERCRANDEAAFNEVVSRYKNKVYNYIYRMTGSSDDAEDLTQEVFIRMYTSIDSFRSQSSLNTWLFRIAGNLCIDRFRRSKNRTAAYSLDDPISDGEGETGREVADHTYEPQRLLENEEMAEQIQGALAQLPEKLRATLLLHDIEGLPYEEIAQVVGCPLGTVKSRLFNARMQLRQRLSGYLNA
ncbi:MAG: sigma-70 family RNA polymerase sigma factor [Armatimonadota bacterium]|nr:sigma-70 family RNA polymerase sigma factor [Armatimonadota bacterium]